MASLLARLSQDDLDREFAAFRFGDAADPSELLSRYVIVSGVGLALWYATGEAIMPIWGFGYVAINTLYVEFLKRHSGAVEPRHVRISLAASSFVAAWYCAMVVYITTLGAGEFLVLAICGCIGLCLHCLSRSNGFTYSAFVDFCAAALTTFGVFLSAVAMAPSTGIRIAILFGAAAVLWYFTLSFRQIIDERQRLRERMASEAQAQKLQALGQLTSGVAHDFNNLLTVVGGNIELALLDDADAARRELLNEARTSVDRGAQLVRQLLAYSRKSRMELAKVDLAQLVTGLQSVLRRTLPSHLELSVVGTGDSFLVKGDAALLESAIFNLVVNARDAIGPARGRITISLETDETGERVVLTVADDGPGMAREVLERATEPFFTTRGVGEGSGLGLPMVKGLAEQMGGGLALESAPGAGLTARISLPRLV